MFALLPLAGGAAGALTMKLLNRSKQPEDVRTLQAEEEKLRRLVRDLERDVRDVSADSAAKEAKLAEALKKADELKAGCRLTKKSGSNPLGHHAIRNADRVSEQRVGSIHHACLKVHTQHCR